MTDIYSRAKRTAIMSSVRRQNTRPETILAKALFRLGLRYRKQVKSLPGTPDLVFPRFRAVVQVNGCFWHGHEHCPKAKLPEANREFWQKKIQANILRDKCNTEALLHAGWRVAIVWECNLQSAKQTHVTALLIENWLRHSRSPRVVIS